MHTLMIIANHSPANVVWFFNGLLWTITIIFSIAFYIRHRDELSRAFLVKKLKEHDLILIVFGSILLLITVSNCFNKYNYWGNTSFKREKFNQQMWFEEEKKYHPEPGVYSSVECVRGGMYDDLHRNHLHYLMSKEEIESLLGHSTVKREYSRLYKYSDSFQYMLGDCVMNNSSSILIFYSIPFTNSYLHIMKLRTNRSTESYEDQKEMQRKTDELYNN